MKQNYDRPPRHNLLQASIPQSRSRRGFLRGAAASVVAIGTLYLAGCGSDDDTPEVVYAHGVASGDPLSDRVMLWTRITTGVGRVDVDWEVASDANFTTIVQKGKTAADIARDFTVKVDATGLQPGTRYWYRFAVGSQRSPVGRTKTLPAGVVAQVKLAVFSCSNYPAGLFNVYAEAAKLTDLDATVHLGDYLYEYGQDGYASGNAASLGRLVNPAGEIVSLADYRARHAQYKTDPDAQALHAAAPMIAVWDDHEIANDTWRNGAENHQPATEGEFMARRNAALQAYHEWMPIRTGADPLQIYRGFDFGNLLALHMLDTRVVARDQQLEYADYFTATGIDAAAFTAAVANPDRQLLGAAQTGWLQGRLQASTATWQVLGQQVLMGRMNIPAPILAEANNPGSGVTASQYAQIVQIAQTNPAALTPTQQAILAQPSIPYNLDAWDGYAAARETVLGTARALDKNLVVLAGDTHNAWANDLLDIAGNKVGVEFAASSVSSPGFEEYLPNENPAVLAASLTQLIGPLQYCDTARRGFMLLTVTSIECRADWVYVDTIDSRSYTAVSDKALKVLPGAAGRQIVAA